METYSGLSGGDFDLPEGCPTAPSRSLGFFKSCFSPSIKCGGLWHPGLVEVTVIISQRFALMTFTNDSLLVNKVIKPVRLWLGDHSLA